MIEEIGKKLLPQIHIHQDINSPKLANGDVYVNLRKLIIEYGQGSGLIMRIAEIVRDKNWKSAWLVLTPQPNAMYTVRRVFWKKCASK